MRYSPWSRFLRTLSRGPRRPHRPLPPRVESLEGRDVPAPLSVLSHQFAGGPGDQTGTAVAVVAGPVSAVYVTGNSAANDGEGLLARYDTSSATGASAPAWSQTWPGAAGFDSFNGVAATPAAVYAAGASFSRTTDTVGGKEHKGITAAFPTSGGVSTWDRQTPGAPGAFPYGGYESLNAVTTAVEGGQTFLYATGLSQQNGINGGRLYVSKIDAAGTVLWTRTDTTSFTIPNSNGLAVAATGTAVYVAGHTNDSGAGLTYLRSYDPAGGLNWSTTTATSAALFGVTVDGGFIYAVGRGYAPGATFVAQKFTTGGALVWSQEYDRGPGEDALTGVALLDGRLYAAGTTRNGTAGGSDGVVLELDPDTGALVETTLWGGPADDGFAGLAAGPGGLHAVGTTRSFGAAGADVAYVVFGAAGPVPVVSVGDTAASEADGSITFTVSLSAPTGQDVTVTFATADGTAGAADYTGATGTVTIPAGMVSADVVVPVNDENLAESAETLVLVVSDPVNATLGTAAGTGTIVDDDAAPVAADDAADTTEDGSAGGNVLANDSDADDGVAGLSAVLGTGPANAAAFALAPDGTFSYTPAASFQALAAGESATDSFTYTATDGTNTGGPATVTVTILGVNDAPVVSAGGPATVAAGGTLSRSGSFADADITDSHTATVDYGDGLGDRPLALAGDDTFDLSATYPAPGTYTVTVKVTDGGGVTSGASFPVVVTAVAPVVSIHPGSAATGKQGRALTVSGSFTGAPGTHAFAWTATRGAAAVDLTGVPGATGTAAPGTPLPLTYTPTEPGAYVFTLTVSGPGGTASASRPVVVTVGTGIVREGGRLIVYGTAGCDDIRVSPECGWSEVEVEVNCVRRTFRGITELVVYANDGDDEVKITAGVRVPATVFGGRGDDRIEAGGGHSVLVGGSGDDDLRGGDGRDILVGGDGRDDLRGRGGDDLLVAGSTAFDANLAALRAVGAEWTSAGSFADRVANLSGTAPPGAPRANGSVRLVAAGPGRTVFDDAAKDTLTGGTGTDWFLLNRVGGVYVDRVTDRTAYEAQFDVDV